MINQAKTLAQLLQKEGPAVIFTGAGASTESGLPDFRSPEGMWRQKDPRLLASTHALQNNYAEFCAFYRWRIEALKQAGPNRVHQVIAKWQKKGLVSTVVTQNVDGFHQLAGAKGVFELHGSLQEVSCEACHKRQEAKLFLKRTDCPACGGRLRPGVVLFGEGLPESALYGAWRAAEEAKLLVVIGSSLEVSPANQLPLVTKSAGGQVVIVNAEPTPLDDLASLVIGGKAGDCLEMVDRYVDA